MVLGLCGLVLLGAALRPTDVQRLSKERAPIDDRTLRRPKIGCGLTERAAGDSCAPVRARAVREEEVRFARTTKAGPRALLGTLSIPVFEDEAQGPRPAIVLLHGSGPQSRDEPVPGDLVTRLPEPLPVFRLLAEHLARQGIVVLRFDKRACIPCYAEVGWEPSFEEYWRQFSFLDFVEDGRAALAFLASRPEVDPEALLVLGHSEGATLAPAVADERARAVILLAPFSESFGEVVLGQLERFAAIRERQWDLLGAWQTRALEKKLARCFEDLAAPPDPDAVCIGGGVSQRALAEYEAWTRETPTRLRALRPPWLALQGSVDRNVFAEEMDVLRALVIGGREPAEQGAGPEGTSARTRSDAEFHLVEGVAHTLANAFEDHGAIDAQVLARIDRFLGSVARTAPPAPPQGG
jgi:uncharacterized protein